MIRILEDAIYLGVAAGASAVMAQIRAVEKSALVTGVLFSIALGFHRQVLAQEWLLDSLMRDVPWMSGLLVGFWLMQARAGWLKVSGWLPTVLLSALVGDLPVALALVVGEPDPKRRARLVLAASGASLLGRGGAALTLGWGGPGVALLGVLLALTGFVGGDMKVGVQRPRLQDAWPGLLVGLCGAVLVWICTVGNLLEILATQLEALPAAFPGWDRLMTTGPCLAVGALAEEGLGGIAAQELLFRGLSLKAEWARQSMLTGLVVGGGLPLLVLTRSSLRVGIPVWLTQVAVLAAWTWWR